MLKYIKSNLLFLSILLLLAAVAFIPELKAKVLGEILKTGLFNPNAESEDGEHEEKFTIAPPMLFKTLDGDIINVGKLRGKVVFINFWATWCPPCIAEMPSINKLKKKLGNREDVIFILADVDSKLPQSHAFMQKKKYDLQVYAPSSLIPQDLFRGSLPTTLVIDKKGRIVMHHERMANYNSKKMYEFMVKLLLE